MVTILCDVTPCSLVDSTDILEEFLPPSLKRRWEHDIIPKHRYLCSRVYGVTSHKS